MLYVILFVVVVVVVVVAVGMLCARVDAIKIERRRASASHAYLSVNTYSKWSK